MRRLFAVLMLGASADVLMRYYDVNQFVAANIPQLEGNTNTALLALYTIMIVLFVPPIKVQAPKVNLSDIKIPEPKLPDKIQVDLSKADPGQIQALAHVIARAGAAMSEVQVTEKLMALRQGISQVESLAEDYDLDEVSGHIEDVALAARNLTKLEGINLSQKMPDLSNLKDQMKEVHDLAESDEVNFDNIEEHVESIIKAQQLLATLKE